MQHKQSHGLLMTIEAQEEPSPYELQIRARGLARLLIYAAHDALDLRNNDVAAALVDVIETIKIDYSLADQDIVPPGVEGLN